MARRRFLSTFFLLAMPLLAAGTMAFLWKRSRPKPVPVATEQPFVVDIVNKIVAAGTIEPRQETEIKPRTSGILGRLLVELGARVKPGQVIGEVQIIPDSVALQDASGRLEVGKIALDRARRDYLRARTLGKQGLTPHGEVERLYTAYQLAEAEVRGAVHRARLVRKGASSADDTDATRIISTVAGTVLSLPTRPGSSVIPANNFNEGTTIAVVADLRDLIFRGKVNESDVGRLQVDMPVGLTVAALDDQHFSARLDSIAPKSQSKGGTTEFEIEAGLRLAQPRALRAGYSANATIVLDRREKVVAINESALVFEGERQFVEVKIGEAYQRREVQLGLSDGLRIEVVSGVHLGDTLRRPRPGHP